jgi:DNA-binding CsgD family transcriptional regulator
MTQDNQPDEPTGLVKPSKGTLKPSRLKKEEQQALARAVQLRVILGRTTEEIAAEFRISRAKVKAKLTEARKDGGAKDVAETLVLERLLPKAVAVFDAALSGEEVPKGTIDVAKDVLFGMAVLKKKDEVSVTHNVSPLEAYRKEREQRLAQEGVVVIDAEPLQIPDKLSE